MPACPSLYIAAALTSLLAERAASARIVSDLAGAKRAASARIVSDDSSQNVTRSPHLRSGWVDGSWNEPLCSQSNKTCLDCQQDSDVCLQSRWDPSYTCATSTGYCTSWWWSADMLECCPGSCQTSGADLAEAPCSHDAYNPNRFGFRLDHARRMSSFAEAAYAGPTDEVGNWTCRACNESGVEVEGDVIRISTTSRGKDPHENFVFVAKLPLPREAEPWVAAAPLSAPENDECRNDVEWAFSTGRHVGRDFALDAYGHMRDFAGVAYENATIEDFQRFFFCGEGGVRCGTPPASCTSPPCSVCPSNPRPFTGGGCMVSFRGSNNLGNLIIDAEAWMDPIVHDHLFHEDTCDGCQVEHGFHDVWSGFAPSIFLSLHRLGCWPNRSENHIYVTGHSLGAAVATLAAAHFHIEGFHVKSAFFFESPRAGNPNFKNWFNEAMEGKDVWRTSNRADIVPDIPYAWMGYEHAGREVFFASHSATDYRVCKDDYECERFKPNIRASVGDHCKLAVVPGGDMCFAETWVNSVRRNVSEFIANVGRLDSASPDLNAS